MNIGYIIDFGCCISALNGIRIQAQVWADELVRKGNKVILINPWDIIEWNRLDVVHVFGQNENLLCWTQTISNNGVPVVVSPIIDTVQSVKMYRLAANLNIPPLRMSSVNNKVKRSDKYLSMWFARSEYESKYIKKAYGVKESKVRIVPLSFRIPTIDYYPTKKPFCLHVSSITSPRKNVMRLMEAAIKYNFDLVLAGRNDPKEFKAFKSIIDANSNISYLGCVSEDKLKELYESAKVFALPSINEGVGMVAVEAAAYGCDIVVTQLGGPKEYYADLAYTVNPYSVDDIGEKVLDALADQSKQPKLMNHIISKYNLSACVDVLLNCYKEVLNNNDSEK